MTSATAIEEKTTNHEPEWANPRAMAIPPEGYFTLERGRYGPTFPRTPACHGFTIIAKIKPGTEEEIRAYGKTLEDAVADDPDVLAPLQLHYLRWVLFAIGQDTYFMYQGIFDTDFDKYTEDADRAVRVDRHHDDLQEARRISGGLEDQRRRRSSSSFAIISARASSSTASIRTSRRARSRRRCA